MWSYRTCKVCGKSLGYCREDKKTCSSACRKQLSRLGAANCDNQKVTPHPAKRDIEVTPTRSDKRDIEVTPTTRIHSESVTKE